MYSTFDRLTTHGRHVHYTPRFAGKRYTRRPSQKIFPALRVFVQLELNDVERLDQIARMTTHIQVAVSEKCPFVNARIT